MIALRFVVGFIIPLAIIFIPIIALVLISGRRRPIDRGYFLMSVLGCFLFGLLGPVLATIIATYGLSFGSDPSDPLCVNGASIYIFFGYMITILGVPIVSIARYPPKRRLSQNI
jgi:hypothetical protein